MQVEREEFLLIELPPAHARLAVRTAGRRLPPERADGFGEIV
jgi:hypothetical protein